MFRSAEKLLEHGFVQRGQFITAPSTALNGLSPIRAARFCAQLGRKLESKLEMMLKAIVKDGKTLSLEQHSELESLMLAPHPAQGWAVLEQIGWVARFVPELEACKTVLPFGFHHLNVLEHSFEALRILVELFPDASLEARWGVLLHDVGKPACKIWDVVRERWSFFGHDNAGALLTRAILERFGFEAEFTERVSLLVERHMIRLPGDDVQAARFARRQRTLLPDLLQIMLADREAARGATSTAESRYGYKLGFERVLTAMKAQEKIAPLMTGRDVMNHLGLAPGPLVGEALEFLREAQERGELLDFEAAKTQLESWLRVRTS